MFAYPITVTELQFLVGSIITLTCWASGLIKVPKINGDTVRFRACLCRRGGQPGLLGGCMGNILLGWLTSWMVMGA